MLKFTTSIPPTANHRLMPVSFGGKVRQVKSTPYRHWLESTAQAIHSAMPSCNLAKSTNTNTTAAVQGKCCVCVEVTFPDRRKRDLDNVLKAVNDAMTQGGAIEDDHLIELQLVVRRPVDKLRPRIDITIWPKAEFDPYEAIECAAGGLSHE